jgi:hypothetical protein
LGESHDNFSLGSDRDRPFARSHKVFRLGATRDFS